jgi:hypothetical protein
MKIDKEMEKGLVIGAVAGLAIGFAVAKLIGSKTTKKLNFSAAGDGKKSDGEGMTFVCKANRNIKSSGKKGTHTIDQDQILTPKSFNGEHVSVQEHPYYIPKEYVDVVAMSADGKTFSAVANAPGTGVTCADFSYRMLNPKACATKTNTNRNSSKV